MLNYIMETMMDVANGSKTLSRVLPYAFIDEVGWFGRHTLAYIKLARGCESTRNFT